MCEPEWSSAKRARTGQSSFSAQPKTLSAVATALAHACGASPRGMETLLIALADASTDENLAAWESTANNGVRASHSSQTARIPSTVVGWLKGKQGGMIREIEGKSGARIDIDQETKELGYCTVHISGLEDQRRLANGFVIAEVMKAVQGTPQEIELQNIGWKEEFFISGQYVGWIKGPKGQVVKDMTSKSGTRIDVEQPSREGDATIRVFGTYEGVQDAKRMIAGELAKVNTDAANEICSDYHEYVRDSRETASVDVNSYDYQPARGGTGSSSSTALPRSSSSNGTLASHSPHNARIPSTVVGWLKGKQGGTIREIEGRSGARISIDQETKDLGYCTVYIKGHDDQRRLAHGFVIAEVMKAVQGTPQEIELQNIGWKEEFFISGQYVGWIKGPKGQVVKDMTSKSGTRIDVEQPSREGDATIRVFGTYEGVQDAKRMIAGELAKVNPDAANEICSDYHEYGRGSRETSNDVRGDEFYNSASSARAGRTVDRYAGVGSGLVENGSTSVDIPNSCVGWLKGKQGSMIRDIESISGAHVSVDQSAKDSGYAQVHISGSSGQMQIAHGLVVAEVMKVIHNSEERSEWSHIGSALELEVSAQYVGWLKGPRGKVVRDMTQKSATRIDIDQTSREKAGVAVVMVFGTHDGVEEARRLIVAELSKVDPEAAAQIAAIALM